MRTQLLLFVFLLCGLGLSADNATIIVSNPTDVQRHEVIELSADELRKVMSVSAEEQFVVINAAKVEVPYQITYDGKFLLDVTVQPFKKSTFTVRKGVPAKVTSSVHGALYKIRKDDIAWENDRGAYRVYGPALQKTGEKSYGTDVWVKNTPSLVVEKRYTLDDEGNKLGDKLYKEGKKHEADSLDLATSFHIDHGDGMDGYGVGATLGCGAPALMDNGHLVYPYCYESYEILDNGPLRFTVKLCYKPSCFGKDTGVVEHRIISLDKGSNFNRMEVWYDGLTSSCDVASGVVIHGQESRVKLGKNFVQYADPTDAPQKNNSEIYVACLFPYGKIETLLQKEDKKNGVNATHALGINHKYNPGDLFVYYFGSAWSEYDCRSQAEWQVRIDDYLKALASPLVCEIK